MERKVDSVVFMHLSKLRYSTGPLACIIYQAVGDTDLGYVSGRFGLC